MNKKLTFFLLIISAFFLTDHAFSMGGSAYTYNWGQVTQNGASVMQGATDQDIVRVTVSLAGGAGTALTATRMDFTMQNTNNADVLNARLFYTIQNTNFSTATQLGATVATPSGTISFLFSQDMSATGNFYYWLAFDIDAAAPIGNTVDALVSVNGLYFNEDLLPITRTPMSPDPAGSRSIIAAPPPPLGSPPAKTWDTRYGGSDNDYLRLFQQTSDGGLIIFGDGSSNSGGDKSQNSRGFSDYWLVKTDINGVKQWDVRFGGDFGDMVMDGQQTTDNGYVIGGESGSTAVGDKTQPSMGFSDYWIVKTDVNGVKQWDKVYGTAQNDKFTCLDHTSDGGYILGGHTAEVGISGHKTQASVGSWDWWIVKIDASGNIQWDKTIGGADIDWLRDIVQTSDGGYLLFGSSRSDISGDKSQNTHAGSYDYWVVKTNSAGVVQWDKTYGGDQDDNAAALIELNDGTFLLGGNSYSDATGDKSEPNWGGNQDFWVLRIDASGNIMWDRTYGGSFDEHMYLGGIQNNCNGTGILISGDSYSPATGTKSEPNSALESIYVLLIGYDGSVVWDKTINAGHDEWAMAIQLVDETYVFGATTDAGIAGDKSQSSRGLTDYWLAKMEGGASCSALLPVNITSIKAYILENATVQIEWQTASEINNDYFIIERSRDGRIFDNIGTVEGAGYSNQNLYYDYIDKNTYQGVSYYRLKQIDYDGKANYSRVVQVMINTPITFAINSIYIDANDQEMHFFLEVAETTMHNGIIDVYNIIGKKVMGINLGTLSKGNNHFEHIDVSHLTTGTYLLKFQLGSEESTKKFVVNTI